MGFKLATLVDEERLIGLMREFYVVEHLSFDEALARSSVQRVLVESAVGVAYVLCVDEETIGYLVLTFGFSLEFGGRFGLLDELYLREQFRGRGAGRACLRFIEQVCSERGISVLRLEVDRSNRAALGLYESAGYRAHDRDLMTKWLDN
ncbi:MAG: GNAT family N-acetyltransferase [Pyrinomonadaceae bacterium]